jgi:hypothetical protein
MRERDLFRAIVLSGTALVATPGCSSTPAATDAGRDAPVVPETDAPVAVADTGTDAPSASDAPELVDAPDPGDPDGFVAII